jgi:hypothetical protein
MKARPSIEPQFILVHMNGQMYGWVGWRKVEWRSGWLGRWMDGRTEGCVVYGWMYVCADGWTKEWHTSTGVVQSAVTTTILASPSKSKANLPFVLLLQRFFIVSHLEGLFFFGYK